jgi:hypothetical protein
MQNFGSPYHKVAGMFLVPSGVDWADGRLILVAEYLSKEPFELEIMVYGEGQSRSLGELPNDPGRWVSCTRALATTAPSSSSAETLALAAERHGSGRLVVTSIRSYGSQDRLTLQLDHGRTARFEVDFTINDPALDEHCQVIFAFHRNGIEDICRVIARELRFNAHSHRRGTVCMEFDRLPLGAAEYTITVLIAKEGYYDSNPAQFYSVNPDVYACHPKALSIKVINGGVVGTGTGAVLDATWTLLAGASSRIEAVS